MRAMRIIQQKLEPELGEVHKRRRDAVWKVVAALLIGGKLWPAALGRHRPGRATDKNGIKAVDRLLGNETLFWELKLFYSAIVQAVLGAIWRPVILVDITELRPGICALTASLANNGRGIPIYGVVRTKKYVTTRSCTAYFLENLHRLLPGRVTPVLVTDAGFQSPWMDAVEGLGWDYVARVRHQTTFYVDGEWVSCQALHKRAKNRAQNLGALPFPHSNPKARRLILAKARKSKGRRRLNPTGGKGRTATDRRCQKSAREPWLLATSLACRPDLVVTLYGLRMQIEQNYRDTKNHRWGWNFSHYSGKQTRRFEILLLISALALVVQHSVGCAGERRELQYSFQANTVSKRRVISVFVLGHFLLRPKHQGRLTNADIRDGFAELCLRIRALE